VNKKNSLAKTISNNNALTAQVLEANTIQSFATALQKKHENEHTIRNSNHQRITVSDFDGIIKSLGAWVAIL
jgi:hypothetical protein